VVVVEEEVCQGMLVVEFVVGIGVKDHFDLLAVLLTA
jgi:hypothetical protein